MKNKKHPSENWIREFHKAAESTTNSLNTILSQIGLYVVEVPHDFSNGKVRVGVRAGNGRAFRADQRNLQ